MTTEKSLAGREAISLRKVSVHNLKSIDLDIPYNKLTAFCGLSGSGKSSLAIDTLYAEGQRRYIESFSAYTRQFLEKLEKPEAERIDGIQPAIAVTSRPAASMSRSTVGTATETEDYLRLLYSKIGRLECQCCGREVRCDSPESILASLSKLKDGTKIIIAFSPSAESIRTSNLRAFESEWKEKGFLRGIVMGESFRLDEGGIPLDKFADARLLFLADQPDADGFAGEKAEEKEYFDPSAADNSDAADDFPSEENDEGDSDKTSGVSEDDSEAENGSADALDDTEMELKMTSRILTIDLQGEAHFAKYAQLRNEMLKQSGSPPLFFIVDRLVIGKTDPGRIRDSLEAALEFGDQRCWVLCPGNELPWRDDEPQNGNGNGHSNGNGRKRIGVSYPIDGEEWTLAGFSRRLRCEDCGIEYPKPEPKLFSFNSPLGACPLCEGFGNLMILDPDLILPNKNKSIRDGAIAPWNSPSYRHKFKELLAAADELGLRTDVPISELTAHEMELLLNGSPKSGYDGLNGFFRRLQKQKYKMHIRVFLSRWRSYRVCPLCHGARLRPESLSVRIGGVNIFDLSCMKISDALSLMSSWELKPWEVEVGRTAITQVRNRLGYLDQVGVGYLTLERQMRTLSEGEQRRVALTSVLGSSLVDMLYVLDEPSIGLHPCDTERLLESIVSLRDRGNTVVVVEHEETILAASDRIVEIGPEAGQSGGQVVFEGTFDEIKKDEKSLTGSYLSGRRGCGSSSKRRILEHGFLELSGANGWNLKNVNAVFPLGVLCLVTGVSGAGKSSLVQETLYPAICQKLGRPNAPRGLPFEKIVGVGQIDDVVLVDPSPIGRSPRSNPITYLKIFDEIRNIFAETPDAKAKNYNAGYFSFNVDGGRCNACKGEGFLAIDMQFMADMFVKCPQCGGRRYQSDILDILYRGKNIAEVLDLTVREAFSFFRGRSKVQQKLKRLIDVGLDYIRLGQPANTLSGGESQRLKLAAYLSNARKGRCLFIMDEPTTGLHFADIVQLLDGFDALIETGHSLIVVEHNLQMMKAADYIIDLGPGAAEQGGTIVAEGTPEQVARNPNSETGRYLAKYLA